MQWCANQKQVQKLILSFTGSLTYYSKHAMMCQSETGSETNTFIHRKSDILLKYRHVWKPTWSHSDQVIQANVSEWGDMSIRGLSLQKMIWLSSRSGWPLQNIHISQIYNEWSFVARCNYIFAFPCDNLCLHPYLHASTIQQFSAMLWREQVNFQVRFVLDQHV
jgi:hypothetical protein